MRRNRGAAGVDGQSILDVEQYGVERFLEALGATLRAGTYRPSVVHTATHAGAKLEGRRARATAEGDATPTAAELLSALAVEASEEEDG